MPAAILYLASLQALPVLGTDAGVPPPPFVMVSLWWLEGGPFGY